MIRRIIRDKSVDSWATGLAACQRVDGSPLTVKHGTADVGESPRTAVSGERCGARQCDHGLVGEKKSRRFDEISAAPGDGSPESSGGWLTWPRPVHDREWIDVDGKVWRMRGGPLDARRVRRLMKRPDVHVVRAYELKVDEVQGAERDALLARVEDFFAGTAPPCSEFELGDFRDQNQRVTLMVQESC